MIISYSKKFVLLAPWKTASQTLRANLNEYDESPYSYHFYFNNYLNRVVHQHITLADFMLLPEARSEFTIGSFVRNPYDRCFSGFLQVQRDFKIQPRMKFDVPWIGDLVRDQISINMNRVIQAGFDFDKWINDLPEYEIYEIGRNTNLPLHPAHYWTKLPNFEVNFIGKVENFREELSRFCEIIGIYSKEVNDHNTSDVAEHQPRSYSRYAGRMSKASIDRINKIFERDFEIFDYERL